MSELSYDAFLAAFAALALALLLEALVLVRARGRGVLAGNGLAISAGPARGVVAVSPRAETLDRAAFVLLTASLALRAIATGHGPFANMFEFSLAFGWGILALHLYFDAQYHLRTLTALVQVVVLGLLAYAATVPSAVEPLVPALRNQALLTVHVAAAIVAYGAFTLAFAAAVLYLVPWRESRRWLPRKETLDDVAYRAVVLGFPMLALVIILGAVWAEIAWGTYWSWDPKETASLATWLIYGGYLHARAVRGWRGRRGAWLLVGGFAATLFTYYGNLFLGGLHGYA